MNDNQPLRRWAIGAALCLTLTYPLMATASEPASEALQQADTAHSAKRRNAAGRVVLPTEGWAACLADYQPC